VGRRLLPRERERVEPLPERDPDDLPFELRPLIR
jgi:hypothetical protein